MIAYCMAHQINLKISETENYKWSNNIAGLQFKTKVDMLII